MNKYLPFIQITVGGIMLVLAVVLIGIAAVIFRYVKNFVTAQADLNRAHSELNSLLMKRIKILEEAVFRGSMN